MSVRPGKGNQIVNCLQPGLLTQLGLNFLNSFPGLQRKRLRISSIFRSAGTTSLSQGISRLDTMHNNRASPREESIAPWDIPSGVIPGHLTIPADAVLSSGQARHHLRDEHCLLVVHSIEEKGTSEVAEVGQRVPHRGHFPIQQANDSRFGFVKYHIIDLIVPVHERAAVLRLRRLVFEETHHVHEMRQLSDRFLGLHIHGLCLRLCNCCEGGDLSIIVPRRFSEPLQPDLLGYYPVEFG